MRPYTLSRRCWVLVRNGSNLDQTGLPALRRAPRQKQEGGVVLVSSLQGLRARLAGLSTINRVHIFAACVTIARLATLDLSSYPIHLGSIEAQYVQAARNHDHTLFYWPLRVLPVELAHAVLGPSLWASRVPTTLLLYPSILAAYKTSESAFGARAAAWSAVAFGLNPYIVTWYGRVMPEAWLILGIVLAARPEGSLWQRGVGVALAVLAKPIGLAALPIFLIRNERWQGCLAVVGAAYAGLAILFPSLVDQVFTYASGRFDAGHAPFEAANSVLVLGLFMGCLPLAWWGFKPRKSGIFILAAGLIGYAFLDAFPNHAYYALPGIALLAVLAGPRLAVLGKPAKAALVGFAVLGVALSLYVSGDLGDDRATILSDLPDGVEVYVPDEWWYFREYAPDGTVYTKTPDSAWTLRPDHEEYCHAYSTRSYGGETLTLWRCPVYRL